MLDLQWADSKPNKTQPDTLPKVNTNIIPKSNQTEKKKLSALLKVVFCLNNEKEIGFKIREFDED